MDDFLIRPASRDDLPAIRSLVRTVRINPIGLKWQHFYIAFSLQGQFLGCGQVKTHSDGSRELASIAVMEAARGRGIARAIIEKLLDTTRARPLFLMCRARLGPLYEKFDFYPAQYQELPLYFKRIKRLEMVLNRNAAKADRLLIMRLD